MSRNLNLLEKIRKFSYSVSTRAWVLSGNPVKTGFKRNLFWRHSPAFYWISPLKVHKLLSNFFSTLLSFHPSVLLSLNFEICPQNGGHNHIKPSKFWKCVCCDGLGASRFWLWGPWTTSSTRRRRRRRTTAMAVMHSGLKELRHFMGAGSIPCKGIFSQKKLYE